MSKGYFITATDTSVGKTVISAKLLNYFMQSGKNPIALKAVQAGFDKDIDIYQDVLKKQIDPDSIMPYYFKKPCSPHLASSLEDNQISLNVIEDKVNILKEEYDVVLVEGAGGILVPLNKKETILDLIKQLDFETILVMDNKLGTINHTLLSLEVLRKNNIKVKGVIANNTKEPNVNDEYIRRENIQAIKQYGNIDNIIEVPYSEKITELNEKLLETIKSFIG